jgi:hypothetical protein
LAIGSPLSYHLLSVLSAPDIFQVFLFFCEVLSDCLMRGSVRSSVPPEAVECGVDVLCIESMGIRVPFVFQIRHNGAGFLACEDGELATRMIVPGHGPVSAWIDERRFADCPLVDPLPSRDLHDIVEKSIREVEHRIRSLQLLFEVGDQIWLFSTSFANDFETNNLNGIFSIAGCKGYPELIFQGDMFFPDFYPDFQDAPLQVQRYKEFNVVPGDELAQRNVLSLGSFYTLLNLTPGNFRVSYPLQMTIIDFVLFFLQYFLALIYRKDLLQKAGVKNVVFREAKGLAHEWQTWRYALHDFAPRLFQQNK